MILKYLNSVVGSMNKKIQSQQKTIKRLVAAQEAQKSLYISSTPVLAILNYTFGFRKKDGDPINVGNIHFQEVTITTDPDKNRLWHFRWGGEIIADKFFTVFQFDPNTTIPIGDQQANIKELNFNSVFYDGRQEYFQGHITVNNRSFDISYMKQVLDFEWEPSTATFTLKFNLTNIPDWENVFSWVRVQPNQNIANYVDFDPLHHPVFAPNGTNSIHVELSLRDAVENKVSTISGFYKILQGNEISNLNDTSGNSIVNLYVNYSNLAVSTTVTSFTSYLSYVYNGSTVTDTSISFLKNVGVIADSTTWTGRAAVNPTIPIKYQTGTFCLPLMKIPTSILSTPSSIKVGYVINSVVYYQLLSSFTSPTSINLHIFDKSINSYNLPTVTYGTLTGNTTITVGSSQMSTAQMKAYISYAMDSGYSLYPGYIASSSGATYYAKLGKSIYISGANGSPVATPGKWFTGTLPTVNGTTVTSGTETYIGSSASTSTQYILLSTKLNNYTAAGLISVSGNSYGIAYTNSNVTISTNSIPTHPIGLFPTANTTAPPFTNYGISNYCSVNIGSIGTASSISFTVKAAKCSSVTYPYGYPLNAGVLGYIFDNSPMFAAGDVDNCNPIALELGDIFMGHVSSAGIYHRHFIAPAIYNWVVDNQIRVIGFLADGYPIVAPFLITKNGTTRVINTSDLNQNHGIVSNISFTLKMSSTTSYAMTFDFFYVATFDYPYTIGSFYGTPITISIV